ncbi:MAG TPA: peptidoglycan editing factor PgeF [Oscillatoriales cyanobacterium M59_W2019_021]|nr:MAG: peptidoglycan editing factor PgeF [Cyanobacteria bacterium J055]HIK30387.1 peptidoglycan editing factor PgeF [Oscillatoriales cyanobacterium M4454_W2019_049]HIK50310.1 peptidoglycan editing factor PgeF [Oscillatoriales cyanobacterium M59_W2019_021]
MHAWHWQTWQGKPYLTCSLFAPWQHGFFTQQFSPNSPLALVEALHPQAEVYRTQQVHGNAIVDTESIAPLSPSVSEYHPADGLLARQSQQAVWVCSADCTPVLIADDRTGHVAAVHSGWRGTAAKIVPQAIAQLQAQGSQIGDLRVALGPAIAGEVYQVSSEVAVRVGATILEAEDDAQTCLDRLEALPNSPLQRDEEPDRVRLDIRACIALQLDRLGLSAQQIAIAPYCTYQDPDNFFSYRRTGQKNVQWSGIVSG